MKKEYFRKFALAMFLDKEGNTIIQDRGEIAKSDEKYGLFGGGIEEGETSKEAIVRELKEELDYDVVSLKLWKELDIQVEGIGLGYFAIYIIPIDKELLNSKNLEGTKVYSTVNELANSNKLDEIDSGFFKSVLKEWESISTNHL